MKTTTKDTRWMVSVALMAAIVVLLANTPLGMIQLPVIKATTVHIPVIIGAVLLGPAAGAILGGVFGICSMISNTTAPTLLSFAFSPFLSSDFAGIFKALWISIGCRIMIGVIAGWLWIALKKVKVNPWIALPVTGFGQHLHSAGKSVRRGEKCGDRCRLGADYGYCHCFRHSGGCCCGSSCHCIGKSTS